MDRYTATVLLCEKCSRSIESESVAYAERNGTPFYCDSCLADATHGTAQAVSLNWRCWTLFMFINLLWFLTIIVITNTSASVREVVTLSTLAFLIYAASLLWLHGTLSNG